MPTQFLRKVSLVISSDTISVDLSEMRFRFTIKQHDLQSPNNAVIRIWNLKDETAQNLQETTQVNLSAGYGDDLGLIFSGTIMQSRRGREDAVSSYLDIVAGDGDLGYNFAVVNASLKAGSTFQQRLDVAQTALGQKGVSPGYTGDLPSATLPRGKVMYGMARDHLRDLAEATGSNWSIQNGAMNFYPQTGYVPGDAVVLNAQSGMIGVPEQTQDGIRVRCLLNPNIKVGGLVQIDNASINQALGDPSLQGQLQLQQTQTQAPVTADGFYRAYVVTHEGDTRGSDWYTDIIAVAMNQGPTPGLVAKGYG